MRSYWATIATLALLLLVGHRAAAQNAGKPTVDQLIKSLSSSSNSEVHDACRKLAMLGPGASKAVPALSAVAAGPIVKNQVSAVEALAYLHTPDTVPALARAAHQDTTYVNAMTGLALVGKQGIAELVAIAQNGTPTQVSRAIFSLGIAGPDALPALAQLHPADRSAEISLKEAALRAQVQNPSGFVDLWRKSSAQDRSTLTMLAGGLGYLELPQLLDALGDPDPQLRQSAARAAYAASYILLEPGLRGEIADPLVNAAELEKSLRSHRTLIVNAGKGAHPDTNRNASLMLMALDRLDDDRRLTAARSGHPLPDAEPAPDQVAALQSADSNERSLAFQRLQQTAPGRRAIIHVLAKTKDPTITNWFRTGMSSGMVPEAIEAIGENDPAVYRFALHIVATYFSPDLPRTPEQQKAIKLAAAKINAQFLESPRDGEEAHALIVLSAHAAEWVMKDLESGKPAVQFAIVDALADSHRSQVYDYAPALRKLVLDSTRAHRPALIHAIALTQNPNKIYDELLHSQNIGLRLSAIDGFVITQSLDDSRLIFEPMLKDPDPDIASAAATALFQKYQLAVHEAQDEHDPLRGSAAPKGLQIPAKTLLSIIDSSTQTEAGKQRAVFEIGELGAGGDLAVAKLTTITRNTEADIELRKEAIGALGRLGIGAQSAIPALKQIASSKDSALSPKASDALKRIQSNDAAPAFKGVERHEVLAWHPQQTTSPQNVIEHIQFLIAVSDLCEKDQKVYPGSYTDLRGYFADESTESGCMTNPRTGQLPGFWYVRPIGKPSAPAPIIYEAGGGPLVGFTDGSVKELNAAAGIRRCHEANLMDLQQAVALYPFKHNRQNPEKLQQLREMFPDEASWQRVISNPNTGESPGYALSASTARPWEADKLKKQVVIYPIVHGVRDSGAPALYGDGQVR